MPKGEFTNRAHLPKEELTIRGTQYTKRGPYQKGDGNVRKGERKAKGELTKMGNFPSTMSIMVYSACCLSKIGWARLIYQQNLIDVDISKFVLNF